MRKVKFSDNRRFNGHTEGFFHQWINYQPGEGDGNATAIVEFKDGSIQQISYEYIIFVYPASTK